MRIRKRNKLQLSRETLTVITHQLQEGAVVGACNTGSCHQACVTCYQDICKRENEEATTDP